MSGKCAPGEGLLAGLRFAFPISLEQQLAGEEGLNAVSLQELALMTGRFAEGVKQTAELLFGPWREDSVPKCLGLTQPRAICCESRVGSRAGLTRMRILGLLKRLKVQGTEQRACGRQ